MPDHPIDRVVLIHDIATGVITARLYRGPKFEDAKITVPALALVVSDGARMVLTEFQRLRANMPVEVQAM